MITLSKENDAIVFRFEDNQHYLNNGKIECPVNSLSLIIDESDMVTIRKAASNDILISGTIAEFGMSKADLEAWFIANAYSVNGGSSIVEVYVGTVNDWVDPNTGQVHKEEGKKEYLCIVYKNDQGQYSLTKVSLTEFILENEFESGVTVTDDGIVHGVVDTRSEKVYNSYDVSGNPATSADVMTVGESGFTVNNIQRAIDEAIKNARKHKVIADELTIHADWTLNDEKKFSSLVYLKKVTSADTAEWAAMPTNVKDRYKLVDALGNRIVTASGATSEYVDIYKDASVVEIYLGTSGDSVNEDTGVITKQTGETKDYQYLIYVYQSTNGKYYMTKIDLRQFLVEPEFKSGTTVNAEGIVIGVVDPRQEHLIIGYNDDYTSAQTASPLSLNESGFTTHFIQDAIDAKVMQDRKTFTPDEGEYNKTNQEITFKSILDNDLFKVQLSGDTELLSGSTNFVQNSAVTVAIDEKADWISAVTSGSVVSATSGVTLEYFNRSGDTLFELVLPPEKTLSGISGVYVASGDTQNIVSGVVDSESSTVITHWNDDGTSATTGNVLSVGADGFRTDNIQEAINAIRHALLIDMLGYDPSTNEDIFGILSGDTVADAFEKIEQRICANGNGVGSQPNNTGLLFLEGGDETIVLSAGEF